MLSIKNIIIPFIRKKNIYYSVLPVVGEFKIKRLKNKDYVGKGKLVAEAKYYSFDPIFSHCAVGIVTKDNGFKRRVGSGINAVKYGFRWEIYSEKRKVNSRKMLKKLDEILEMIENTLPKFKIKYYRDITQQCKFKKEFLAIEDGINDTTLYSNVKNIIRLQYKDYEHQDEYYFYFPEDMLPTDLKDVNILREMLLNASEYSLQQDDIDLFLEE